MASLFICELNRRFMVSRANLKGENAPNPFITFEATSFPPEILRDMCNICSRGGAHVVRCIAMKCSYTSTTSILSFLRPQSG
ncbi:unnamed protein product [Cuscuta campestris]|uniref:Uncharacterized protein n=1 Tax=Cuscuta campestris TaxID=132261 RepID=A0A484KWP8_9ASTE|nr:unnamed protein product [Cuscuta campestris]